MRLRSRLPLACLLAALAACDHAHSQGAPVAAPASPPPPTAAPATASAPAIAPPPAVSALARIGHVIILYEENWSFDGLYGRFPGADGAPPGTAVVQVDAQGQRIDHLPQGLVRGRSQPYASGRAGVPDPRLPAQQPVAVFDLAPFIPPDRRTGDLIHAFYTEQVQIDGGRMDRFVSGSTNPGLVLGTYDATGMPEGELARSFTLYDHCFHSAFGGSFLNHQWLIAARTPPWPTEAGPAPEDWRSRTGDVDHVEDRPLSADGTLCVNTLQPANVPSGEGPRQPRLWTHATIGDRLDAAHIPWAWYAGGWNRVLASQATYQKPDLFQVHHQPFLYFAAFDAGTPAGQEHRAAHLKDEEDFLAALRAGTLPPVAFVKPSGVNNEHPGYATLLEGQRHVAALVQAIQASPVWQDAVVFITYDEHGGRWDHVAPPVEDAWGPGVRVPMILISPFARRGVVVHDTCETVSVLRLIEERWHLPPLGTRDAHAGRLDPGLTAP